MIQFVIDKIKICKGKMLIDHETVTIDNALVTAKYSLSLMEKRIIILALAKVRTKVKKVKETVNKEYGGILVEVERNVLDHSENILIDPDTAYYVSAEDYAIACEVSLETAKDELQEAVNSLYEQSVEFFDSEEQLITSRWLSAKAKYDNESHCIGIFWAPKIIPFISALTSNFTTYKVATCTKLQRVSSNRLYEILYMEKCKQKYKQVIRVPIHIDKLLELMGKEDTYSIFADFRKRIIDPAVKEINEKTNLQITYYDGKEQPMYIKIGRKVVGINFSVSFLRGEINARI